MVLLRKSPSRLLTDRPRGGRQFVERRTNAWAFWVGYFTGRGHNSEKIAEQVGGTHPATVRRMWSLWGLPPKEGGAGLFVSFTVKQHSAICARAAQHDIAPEEYCRLMLIHGSMPKDRFHDLIGGNLEHHDH